MAETLREVLVDQRERGKLRADPGRPPSPRTSPWEWMAVGLLAVLSAFFWLGSPGWLHPPPPEPLSPELVEAGLRMEIGYQAYRVRAFRGAGGRFPNSLQEAGDPFAEVKYDRRGPQDFRLWMESGGIRVEYSSGESLGPFLAEARKVILEDR